MQTAESNRADGEPERDSVAFVRFRLGGFPLALEADHVVRVSPVPERTRLPGAPAPVAGLGYVAGRPTTLVSLAARLDVDPEGEAREVVTVRGHEGPPVGLLVDGTSGLLTAPVDAVTPPAESGDFFLGDTTDDPLFRAVATFDDGPAYVLSPGSVHALTGEGGYQP
jgi:chemotaxis signal transduction protein